MWMFMNSKLKLLSKEELKLNVYLYSIENLVSLMDSRCLPKFQKVSFLGESRLEKDIVKPSSYIFYQKDPSSQINFIKVFNLNVILDQDNESVVTDSNFILLYKFQGILFNTDKVSYKSDGLYYECLKFLNSIDIVSYPIIIIPNHGIYKSSWKFTRKQPQITKIYAEKLTIRITDNLPISQCSTFILPSSSEVKSLNLVPSALSSKFEETYFKIYEVISKIHKSTEISLSLEIYQ